MTGFVELVPHGRCTCGEVRSEGHTCAPCPTCKGSWGRSGLDPEHRFARFTMTNDALYCSIHGEHHDPRHGDCKDCKGTGKLHAEFAGGGGNA